MPVAALALLNLPLFKDAPETLLHEIGSQMELVQLRKREVWFDADRPALGLGVVLQGRMHAVDHTLDGKEVTLLTAEAGEVFGHMELLALHPTPLNWVALTSASIGWLPESQARGLLGSTDLLLRLAQNMAQQLSDFLGWQKLLSVNPIGARVCAWLLWQEDRDISAGPALTHAELAWRLNTTRESITRTLQRLQSEGWISREGDVWVIKDRKALLYSANGELHDQAR